MAIACVRIRYDERRSWGCSTRLSGGWPTVSIPGAGGRCESSDGSMGQPADSCAMAGRGATSGDQIASVTGPAPAGLTDGCVLTIDPAALSHGHCSDLTAWQVLRPGADSGQRIRRHRTPWTRLARNELDGAARAAPSSSGSPRRRALQEHRSHREFRTDSSIEFVRTACLSIDPGKTTTDCWKEGLAMDRARVVREKHAASRLHTRPPLAPMRPVDGRLPESIANGRGFIVAERDPVGAAR